MQAKQFCYFLINHCKALVLNTILLIYISPFFKHILQYRRFSAYTWQRKTLSITGHNAIIARTHPNLIASRKMLQMDHENTNPQISTSIGQAQLNLPALQANGRFGGNTQKKLRAISDETQASTILLSTGSQNPEEQKQYPMTGFQEGKKFSGMSASSTSDLAANDYNLSLAMSKSNSAMPPAMPLSFATRPTKSAQNEALTRSCASHQFGDSLSSPMRPSEDSTTGGMRDIKQYRFGQGLGKGAIGSVHMVMHKTRKEVYALKQVVYHTSVSRTLCSLKGGNTEILEADQNRLAAQVNAQFILSITRG